VHARRWGRVLQLQAQHRCAVGVPALRGQGRLTIGITPVVRGAWFAVAPVYMVEHVDLPDVLHAAQGERRGAHASKVDWICIAFLHLDKDRKFSDWAVAVVAVPVATASARPLGLPARPKFVNIAPHLLEAIKLIALVGISLGLP